MNPKILLVILAALLAIAAQAAAPDDAAGCVIRIDEPSDEQEVGFTIYVQGTAALPPDSHLWVFARPESHHTLGKWWPQDEGRVNAENHRWRVRARLGSPANVGEYFELAVAVFEEKEHQILRASLIQAEATRIYDSIDMPAAVCPPVTITVRKTSHLEP
ncbi:MAG TPA: hypothetical protein VKM72_23705 [Thermoanaerobaculia bacterium]|nr:hypothetical protein [Thermoanaerobaculia bacterium]